MRSPLSRLRNRLEAKLIGPIDEVTARETLTETVQEVDQVLTTFNAILRLSRVNEGAEGKMLPLDVAELAEEMAELFHPAFEEAGLDFDSQVDRDLNIRGDSSLLAQAIANLLDNAVKYTPEGESVSLNAHRRDGQIVIVIEDSGPGIPETDLERVKSRFVRLDDARTQAGSGLGLAMVEAVAQLHGGSFTLANSDGESGLKASIMIPTERK